MTPDKPASAADHARTLALAENYKSAAARLALPETGLSQDQAAALVVAFHMLHVRLGDNDFTHLSDGRFDRPAPDKFS